MTVRVRPCLLVAMCLALALAGAGCGSDVKDGSSSDEARTLLERASQSQIDSGDLRLDLKADVKGVESLDGPITLSVQGPFRSNGAGRLPSLDWDISFHGAGQQLSGGLIVTHDNAFVSFQGKSYELGRKVFAQVAGNLRESQPDRPLSAGALGLDPASWLEDPQVEDGQAIGGEKTRRISGAVDIPKVLEDFVDLLKAPAVRAQLERSGLDASDLPRPTEQDLADLEETFDRFDVQIDVDARHVLRRLFTAIDFDVPEDGDRAGVKGTVALTTVLRKVNANQVIRSPSNARALSELLGGFLLGTYGSGLDRPRK